MELEPEELELIREVERGELGTERRAEKTVRGAVAGAGHEVAGAQSAGG